MAPRSRLRQTASCLHEGRLANQPLVELLTADFTEMLLAGRDPTPLPPPGTTRFRNGDKRRRGGCPFVNVESNGGIGIGIRSTGCGRLFGSSVPCPASITFCPLAELLRLSPLSLSTSNVKHTTRERASAHLLAPGVKLHISWRLASSKTTITLPVWSTCNINTKNAYRPENQSTNVMLF